MSQAIMWADHLISLDDYAQTRPGNYIFILHFHFEWNVWQKCKPIRATATENWDDL